MADRISFHQLELVDGSTWIEATAPAAPALFHLPWRRILGAEGRPSLDRVTVRTAVTHHFSGHFVDVG